MWRIKINQNLPPPMNNIITPTVSSYSMPVKVPQHYSQPSFPHGTTPHQLLGKVSPTVSPIVNAARRWKSTKKLSSQVCRTPWERKSPQWFQTMEIYKIIYIIAIKNENISPTEMGTCSRAAWSIGILRSRHSDAESCRVDLWRLMGHPCTSSPGQVGACDFLVENVGGIN